MSEEKAAMSEEKAAVSEDRAAVSADDESLSADDLVLLQRAVDHVVAVELRTGEQFFAEVAIVVDEPPTPDVFLIRVEREPDGVFVAPSEAGESILLADIRRVAPIPGVDYPPLPSA